MHDANLVARGEQLKLIRLIGLMIISKEMVFTGEIKMIGSGLSDLLFVGMIRSSNEGSCIMQARRHSLVAFSLNIFHCRKILCRRCSRPRFRSYHERRPSSAKCHGPNCRRMRWWRCGKRATNHDMSPDGRNWRQTCHS